MKQKHKPIGEYIEDARTIKYPVPSETIPILAKVWARVLTDVHLSTSVQLMQSQWAVSTPALLSLTTTIDAVRDTTEGNPKSSVRRIPADYPSRTAQQSPKDELWWKINVHCI